MPPNEKRMHSEIEGIIVRIMERKGNCMTAILENRDFKFREDPGDPWVGRFHHLDLYPAGDGNQCVRVDDLEGHTPGKDISEDLPWKMYFGKRAPGFPMHSHRGFETVTIVLQGVVDHHDSADEHGRYMAGDVQWMTAGEGIRHSEMFPLVYDEAPNTTELFQLWLSLPSWNKLVPCDYKMNWREDIPILDVEGGQVRVITGTYRGTTGPTATEASWASDPRSKMRILLVELERGGRVEIDNISETLNRNLYFYEGDSVIVDGETLHGKRSLKLKGDADFVIEANEGPAKLLLLEAEPIGEPIINDGPMIMNTQEEILQGYRDYWDTHYGEWNWGIPDPMHDKKAGRLTSRGENPRE